jgi:hypothetical protein
MTAVKIDDVGLRLREFVLTTYNNLPNTLFISSLLLGAIQGNLSMMWVSIGMLINTLTVVGLQELLGALYPSWAQVFQPGSKVCSIVQDTNSSALTIVAPSLWFASTTYFVVFILYNAVQLVSRPPNKGVNPKKVDVRIAFSMSIIIMSVFFFLLLLLRGFTGCETWLGSVLGMLTGSGIAIGYWHLLNVCNSGITPDIFNMVSALAPAKADSEETPVICTA